MREIGIYVHIPFCIKKCKYCDFISFETDVIDKKKYFESLKKSIKNVEPMISKLEENKNISKEFKNKDFVVDTIYFGGGTPSCVKVDFIIETLETIKEKFKIKENTEITIEVNPGAVNEEKLKLYKDFGFNRISIGLQESHNEILNLIGRIHTYEEFLETFEMARKVGFKNINVDLMLALPNQSLKDIEESVNRVIELAPEHISLYSLILEEGTILAKEIYSKKLSLPKDDLERKMYHKTKQILENHGYIHYEISNFSKKAFESKHNINCWNQKEYIGFGISAHSYIEGIRFSNVCDLEKYIFNVHNEPKNNIEINEIQNNEDIMKEYMMLGFRKIEGIKISEFEQKFKINPLFYFRFEIEKLSKDNLIEVDLDNIKLTNKGLDFANIVFEEFI